MKWFFRLSLSLFIIVLTGVVSIAGINKYLYSKYSDKIKTSITEIPIEESPRIAIVFGAGVRKDGSPSDVLYDRVLTSAELYHAGRVKKLLMSGDNPNPEYDEPTAMKKIAVELGVAESDIVPDFAGRSTYDTCRRANEIFEVQKAILITQEFHQVRSLYLCNNLGVDSIGITANKRKYSGQGNGSLREFISVAKAWFEINFISLEPIKEQKEPIQK